MKITQEIPEIESKKKLDHVTLRVPSELKEKISLLRQIASKQGKDASAYLRAVLSQAADKALEQLRETEAA